MTCGIETSPGIQTWIARLLRRGIQPPLFVTRFRIERLQVRWLIRIVTGTNNDVVSNHHRHIG